MAKRIIFVGDQHFNHRTPSSRCDDFPEAIIRKLEWILDQATDGDIIILSGDFFHVPTVPDQYKNRLISALKKRPDQIYTIYGNHDISKTSKTETQDSSLSVLINSGVIRHLDELVFGNFFVKGVDFNEELPDAIDVTPKGKVPVFVVHRFIYEEENPLISSNEVFYRDQIEGCGARVILAGHDHSIYPTTRWGKTYVVRPGALSRGTAHNFNKVRDIFVATIDIETGEIDYLKVPCAPPEEVFHKDDVVMDVVMTRVEDFVKLLKSQRFSFTTSMTEMVNKMQLDPPVRKKLFEYLSTGGVSIEGVNVDL